MECNVLSLQSLQFQEKWVIPRIMNFGNGLLYKMKSYTEIYLLYITSLDLKSW